MKKLCFVLCIAFMPNAYAQFGMGSGNSWMVYCERYGEQAATADTMCELYTQGIIEGWHYAYGKGKQDVLDGSVKQLAKTDSLPFCLSESHSTKQHILVVRQYIEERPTLRHFPASFLIGTAMSKAFPCSKENE